MKSKLLKKILITTMAAVITCTAFSITSEAKMGGGSFVSINSGTVDSITVNGVKVDAVYKNYGSGYDYDSTYCCAAFVHRFYSQVFGRNVYGLNSTTSVPQIDQGNFLKTSSPKVGDIVRDNVSVHWAIVKSVDGNTVTVIQQNAWNSAYTKAWVGATLDVSDSRYSFFTWSGNNTSSTSNTSVTSHSFEIQYHDLETYDTNALPHAYVKNPERLNVRQVGCYLWDENGSLLTRHDENCDRSESKFNMWYDINAELGITLEPGTTYQYQFYVVYDGVEYDGSVESFTTTGTKAGASYEEKAKPGTGYVTDGIMVMQGLLGQPEDFILEVVTDDVEKSGNKLYFDENSNGLFECGAPLIVTLDDSGMAKEVSYQYTYTGSDYESASEELYQAVIKVGNQTFGKSGTGKCPDKYTEKTTWKGAGSVERKLTNGQAVVTVTVNK